MGISTENEFQFRPKQTGPRNYFCRKLKKVPHLALVTNNANFYQCKFQKHLGIILDSNLTFEKQYKMKSSKTNRTIELLRKL